MAEKQTIKIIYSDGTEDVIEIDKALYQQFSDLAKDMGISEDELLEKALNSFLKKEGY